MRLFTSLNRLGLAVEVRVVAPLRYFDRRGRELVPGAKALLLSLKIVFYGDSIFQLGVIDERHIGLSSKTRTQLFRLQRDRAKGGVKRSPLTEASGIVVGIVIEGANRHDMKLVCPTLQSVPPIIAAKRDAYLFRSIGLRSHDVE